MTEKELQDIDKRLKDVSYDKLIPKILEELAKISVKELTISFFENGLCTCYYLKYDDDTGNIICEFDPTNTVFTRILKEEKAFKTKDRETISGLLIYSVPTRWVSTSGLKTVTSDLIFSQQFSG
jgi:hypothetical protein